MTTGDNKEDKKQSPIAEWFRHAFAVDKYDESSLSEADKEILDRLANQIIEKKMTAAAILWIHSNKHFNFLGSQAMVAAAPVLDVAQPMRFLYEPLMKRFGLFIPLDDLPQLYTAFEKRYSVEYLVLQLESGSAGDYNTPTADTDKEDSGKPTIEPEN